MVSVSGHLACYYGPNASFFLLQSQERRLMSAFTPEAPMASGLQGALLSHSLDASARSYEHSQLVTCSLPRALRPFLPALFSSFQSFLPHIHCHVYKECHMALHGGSFSNLRVQERPDQGQDSTERQACGRVTDNGRQGTESSEESSRGRRASAGRTPLSLPSHTVCRTQSYL